MRSSGPEVPWTVIVPVKSTRRGKSRIALPPAVRRRVALAMALDTVASAASAASVGEVLVVLDDIEDSAEFADLAAVRVMVTSTPGLNAVIGEAASSVAGPVAVLPGDLPGVAGAELDAALVAAVRHPMLVVADRQGRGTTLLAAVDSAVLAPQYGPDSFRRHQLAGAVALDLPVDSGIRRDVDTLDDLAEIRTGRTAVAAGHRAGVASDLGQVC